MSAHNIAVNVAAELGAGWLSQPGQHERAAYMNGPGGERVLVLHGGYGQAGRIELRMSPGHDLLNVHSTYSDPPIPSITVADTRPPSAIAREIERRLLPKLRELLLVLTARKVAQDERERQRGDLCADLLAILGPAAEHVTRNGLNELRVGRYDDPLSATIKVGHGGESVEFEVRANAPEVARGLAQAIRSARAGYASPDREAQA